MYGLPHQGEEEVRRTARWAADQSPGRLANLRLRPCALDEEAPAAHRHRGPAGAGERLAQPPRRGRSLSAPVMSAWGSIIFARPDDTCRLPRRPARCGAISRGIRPIAPTRCCRSAFLHCYLPQGYIQNAADRRRLEAGDRVRRVRDRAGARAVAGRPRARRSDRTADVRL